MNQRVKKKCGFGDTLRKAVNGKARNFFFWYPRANEIEGSLKHIKKKLYRPHYIIWGGHGESFEKQKIGRLGVSLFRTSLRIKGTAEEEEHA